MRGPDRLIEIYLGTSGYSYKDWSEGVFYPKGLKQNEWLEFYSRQFNAVELNVTFYRLLSPKVSEGFLNRTPAHFRFAVKGSRFITHIKRLVDVDAPLKKFKKSLLPLKPKIKCVLWQLPPSFHREGQRLADFCRNLRKDIFFKTFDHAFEFRHPTWFGKNIYRILEEHNACLAFFDSPSIDGEEALTASYIYVRFPGPAARYASNYSGEQLTRWVKKIKTWEGASKDCLYLF